MKMASCDDHDTTNVDDSNHIREIVNVREKGFAAAGEGRISRPSHVLGTSFPSFPCNEPFDNGTPSSDVQLCLPRRHEHIGERAHTSVPVQNINLWELKNNIKKTEELFLLSTNSVTAITAKVGNADVDQRRDSCDQRDHARDQSVSALSSFTSWMTNICSDPGQNMDRYNSFDSHQERSVSPHNRAIVTYNFRRPLDPRTSTVHLGQSIPLR